MKKKIFKKKDFCFKSVACAGFILAGAENYFRGGRKKSGGAESRPKGAKKNSAPPAEFDSAPGAEQTRGGAENLCIPKALIRTFHTSFLTTQ